MILKPFLAAFWGIFFVVTIPFVTSAQDLKQVLRKAITSSDSSHIYFSQAKKLAKNEADLAEFAFAKNAWFSNQGSLDSCLNYGNQALSYFEKSGDLLRQIYIRHNFGKAYRNHGQYEKAIEVLFEAVPLSERFGDISWQGWILQGISLNYHDFGDYEKGVFYGKKSDEILFKNLENDPMSVVIALNTIAINYDDWGKYDSALMYHFKVLELKPKLDTLQIGFTYNNIGNTLIKQQKLEEAKKWISTAVQISEILQGQGSNQDYDLATYYTNLGRIDYQIGEIESAQKALAFAKSYSLKSESQEKIRDAFEALYEFHKTSSRPDSALSYLELLTKIQDSTFNEDKARIISETEAKFQVAEKERILAEERLKTQKITFGAAILGLFLVASIVVGVLFFRQQKLKAEQKDQELQLQKVLAQVEIQNHLTQQRNKISKDLHDNIGVQLTLVTLGIERLKNAIQPHSEEISNQIKGLKSFTQNTISELRDTIWAMNQEEMSFGDLQARLLNFFEKAGLSEDFELILDFQSGIEELPLGSFQGITLYRILQEGINNALKHSGADRISARITKLEDKIEITIEDNGRGMDSELINSKNTLQSLRKRVLDLNGKIDIQSPVNQGTQIHIFFLYA